MTAKELNRDIKRLAKKDADISKMNSNDAYYQLRESLIKEYTRLYYADKEFKYMNAASMRIMIRLNGIYRAIPLHQFGLNIEL